MELTISNGQVMTRFHYLLYAFNAKERITEMEKRSGVTIIRSVFLLGVMIFLMGGSPATAAQASHESKEKQEPMGIANKTESSVIPPIDAAVPAHFETASFGLG